jgi:flagellar assembly protein FliH
MLSKVLKGEGARLIRGMQFTEAVAVASELRPAAALGRAGAGREGSAGEQAALADKIRTLEAEMVIAKRDAFEAGRQQGEQTARAEVIPVLERLNASIAGIVDLRPGLRRRAEKDAVELSLQIARRVLHRELSIDDNALNALARVVFDRLARTETWQMTVHPQFAEAIRGSLPARGAGKIRIEADASCEPGTLVVKCSEGVIDASVDSQLAEISHGLTDRLIRK